MCTSSSCANSSRRRVLTYHSHNIPVQNPSSGISFRFYIPFRLSDLLKPKMFLIIALFFCWNLRNSIALASYQTTNYNENLPFFHHMYQRSLASSSSSSHPNLVPSNPHHQRHHNINIRMRSPSQLAGADQPLGGAGITLADETALQIVDPVVRRSSPPSTSALMIPRQPLFGGGSESEFSEPKRKKGCGEPSVATRSMLGPSLKRSFFAFTQDEVDEKVKNDEYRQASERRKRDVQHRQLSASLHQKRSGTTATTTAEGQDSPLPWTCETKYEWKDMGINHYPRFVRTAECKTRLCFNGFFRCRPRRYKTKVLKRITPTDSTSCEEDDVSLPETLRQGWKFVTVTINLCCDCTGRLPGTPEI